MDTLSLKFTHIIPLVSAMFVFWFGLIVFNKSKKTIVSITFLLFSIAVTGWLAGTFMLFISGSESKAFFWDKFIYSFVILIPALIYHFSVSFLDKKRRKTIIMTYIVFFLVFLTNIFTDSFIDGAFYYKWGVHMKAQLFHHIFLFLFFAYSIEIYRLFIIYIKNSIGTKKKQAILIFIGFLNFGTVGFTGFLPAYEISVYPFAYLSGLFFAIITGYAITKYQFLEIKTFAIQFFIAVINIISFSYIFVSKSPEEYVIKILFFIGILFVSYFLKRSFEKEVEQREKLNDLAKKLVISNEKLKKIDKAKNEFISIAAHQLRTPLTSIRGYLMMAQDGTMGKISASVRGAINNAMISNERLVALTDDLLNVSRVDSNRMKYEFENVQIDDTILKELQTSFQPVATDKNLKLVFKYPAKKLPKIQIDRKRIREVISNLIDNAIKYTEKGSVIVSTKKENNSILIKITDTGIGIPKSEMPYLFKKFSRGKNTARLGAEGTGLGIYLGRKVLEAHHGEIWAESEGDGKGSTFVIKLPLSVDDNKLSLKKERNSSKNINKFVENI